MRIETLQIPSIFLITPRLLTDNRGTFEKSFIASLFKSHGMDTEIQEEFASTSESGVIRGMHFQSPPMACAKYVSVTSGSILDVVLDLRRSASTYGTHITILLSAENHQMLYIPQGFAHGFLALEDKTVVRYLQTREFSPDHDKGIHFDSFGCDWQVSNPILSNRDKSHPPLSEFETPFK
ncbi:MAG TPA: dTDP-4-dehydrorhamnose 3,5-epimerase [Candidatus Paceibacterota bacterium]|nr:dTDP-4-dehydrorhamnose 3,5-epimerase [Candidatus Paceibacterota bacterium]